MKTEVLTVSPADPEPDAIDRAGAILRRGGLVAFPTETVYGLGANALDAAAVQRIFQAKGRPATNPVIVHVADPDSVLNVAAEWPETAKKLAERFWPGPLTLVLAKNDSIPAIVTAGGTTVAVRCPLHPVARALIRAAGVPLAAPSANRSTELSPTRAEHVLHSLDGRIDLILDGGPCPGGLESTVVDVSGPGVRVLRHGLITVPMLEAVVGPVEVAIHSGHGSARSPGQMAKHYSPRTKLRLVPDDSLMDEVMTATHAGLKVGSVYFHGTALLPNDGPHVSLPEDAPAAAARLYETLFRLDRAGLDLILVAEPPEEPEWAAVRDRLIRASYSTTS
jgi:L-threonylcarbamoyladenylate synthase